MTRVALVHSFYSSAQPSGENTVVREQARALSDAGYDVRLFAQDTDQRSTGGLYPLQAAWTTATGRGPSPDLDAWRPDVVHVHNTFPNWGTRWLAAWRDRLVMTLHNYRSVCAAATLFRDGHDCTDCLARPVRPAIQHRCYRGSRAATVPLALASRPGGALREPAEGAARVIVLNDAAKEVLSGALGREVDVVPNFVAEAEAGLDGGGWAYVGRLDPTKGVDRLVRDWPGTRELHVFGAGPLDEEVRRLAGTRPHQHVHGLVAHDQLLGRLAGMRALVVPSLWSEGIPTVALEALARGVPLVLSSKIAAAAAMEQAGAAVRYDPDSPADLERALQVVDEQRTTLSAAARRLHASSYSEPAWIARVGEIYAAVSGAR